MGDAGDLEQEGGTVIGVEHVQLAMPPGGEDEARAFYQGLLGIPEVAKPAALASRGGCWFEVAGLDALLGALRAGGHDVVDAEGLEGWRRVHTSDPFGNRIELMERTGD